MAAVIGSLRAILGLDSAEFASGLKKASIGLNGFVKTAGISLAAVATAAAAAGVALGVAVKGAIDNADQMGEMAEKIGVSVEALSSLSYAAKLSGTDTETLSTSLRKLSQNMLAVAQGTAGAAATAFQALGVTIREADGSLRASDAVLIDLADRFARMEDGATKTALAIQLFGRSGTELIPFLNQGSAGLAELTAEADRLGITISGQTANAAGDFNDVLDRLRATFDGVINKIAAGALPALNQLGTKLADPSFAANAQAIGAAIVQGMGLAVDAINNTLGAMGQLQQALTYMSSHDLFGNKLEPNLQERRKGTFDAKKELTSRLTAGDTGTDVASLYRGIFGAVPAQIEAESQQVAAAFVPVIENTKAASGAASELKAVMTEGQAVFTATRTPAEAYGLEVERLNMLLQKGAIDQDTYNRAVTQAQDAFQKAENSGGQLADTLSTGLANVFSSVIDGSKSAVEAVGDLIKSLGQMALMEGFKGLFGGIFGGGGGISSLFSGFKIPSFAGGGFTGPGNGPGLDGKGGFLAMLHPNETVLDHSRGQGGNVFHITGSRQDAAEIAREVRKVLPDAMDAYNRNPHRRT